MRILLVQILMSSIVFYINGQSSPCNSQYGFKQCYFFTKKNSEEIPMGGLSIEIYRSGSSNRLYQEIIITDSKGFACIPLTSTTLNYGKVKIKYKDEVVADFAVRHLQEVQKRLIPYEERFKLSPDIFDTGAPRTPIPKAPSNVEHLRLDVLRLKKQVNDLTSQKTANEKKIKELEKNFSIASDSIVILKNYNIYLEEENKELQTTIKEREFTIQKLERNLAKHRSFICNNTRLKLKSLNWKPTKEQANGKNGIEVKSYSDWTHGELFFETLDKDAKESNEFNYYICVYSNDNIQQEDIILRDRVVNFSSYSSSPFIFELTDKPPFFRNTKKITLDLHCWFYPDSEDNNGIDITIGRLVYIVDEKGRFIKDENSLMLNLINCKDK